MTEKCFDIGTIQAFLDGELHAEMTETVARHVAACDDCAILLAVSEEESAFAFETLDAELNALVPTQRLWTKINHSIEREKKSFWQPIFAFLLKPQTAAFASLLFVAVVSISLLSLKPNAPTNYVARKNESQPIPIQPVLTDEQIPFVQTPPATQKVSSSAEPVNYRQNKSENQTPKISHAEPKSNRTPVKKPIPESAVEIPATGENILGEASYIKTIATLKTTVDEGKDEVLNASARFAYERDLAMTEDAIKKMREEIRKNPKNEAAKQILRASYQNKIDLLNSVADKTELMASLK